MNDPATSKAETEGSRGFDAFEAWKQYQSVAMHFNDLLMRLRGASLAAVGAFAAVAGVVIKTDIAPNLRWGAFAGVFLLLACFWMAIWILDFLYYNRLLIGAVDALIDLEESSAGSRSVRQLNLSTRIERVVAEGKRPEKGKLGRESARWWFYGIVFAVLISGFAFSIYSWGGFSLLFAGNTGPGLPAEAGGTAMNSSYIALILTALGSFGALGAAVAAWRSAKATSQAAEGQLFSLHYAEYGTVEMLHSLRMLRLWKADMGDEFEVKWRRSLDAGDERAHEVDRARRHVKFYFFRALRAHQAGYASERFVRELANVDGVNILYDIVEPLEYALNPGYNRSGFDTLRRLCGRAGSGRLIAPVPTAKRRADRNAG